VLLSLGYGCGLRAGEVVRLKVKHIDRAQNIIRVEQSNPRSIPRRAAHTGVLL
jgi:integrase